MIPFEISLLTASVIFHQAYDYLGREGKLARNESLWYLVHVHCKPVTLFTLQR